jgi:long-subunit fatty acid transport protein
MKVKHIFCLLAGICFLNARAQNEFDALRYSTIGAGGTARSLGMAGSFSAIGPDASALFINPACIGTFRRSELNFGFQFQNTLNNATYIGSEIRESRLNFNIPSFNLVGSTVKYDAGGKPKKTGLAAICYGFGVNRLATFNGRISFDALNTKSSVSDFLAEQATAENSAPFDLFFGGLGRIAYDAGAIDNILGTNNYVSNYTDSIRNCNQSGEVLSNGAIYENQFTGGLNFSNRFYVGLGLFYSGLRYSENLSILEEDLRPNSGDMKTLDYQFKFSDRGRAVGARFGLLVKVTEQMRVSAAVHTPRTFSINSEYIYSVGITADPNAILTPPPAQYSDPLNTYKYKVTTPARYNLGVGFVISKIMLLNAEFDFYDYTSARLSADDVVSFNAENSAIRKTYRNVTNTRLGAEFNFPNPENKEQSYRVRMGFANQPSAFGTRAAGLDQILKKGNNMLACGFGFRDKDYYLDFSLTYGMSSGYYAPYVTSSSIHSSSSITNRRNRTILSFTLGLNLN